MRYFHPAKPNELQCDLDDEQSLVMFRQGLRMLKESKHLTIRGSKLSPSYSQGHLHGRVWLSQSISDMERILLQAALGDDPVRVLMNWGRLRNGDPYPVLLINHHYSPMRCNCDHTDCLPRCKCLRKWQNSQAEFMPAKKRRKG